MRVRVLLFGELRRLLPRGQEELWVELPADARVADALAAVGVTPADECIAGLNGELARGDAPLHDGDTLSLYHPMAGGAGVSPNARRCAMLA
jgi:sulfur carrier protein ThiS